METKSQDLQKAWDERMEMHTKANKLFDEGAELDEMAYEKFMRDETEVRQYPGETLKSQAMELKAEGDYLFILRQCMALWKCLMLRTLIT